VRKQQDGRQPASNVYKRFDTSIIDDGANELDEGDLTNRFFVLLNDLEFGEVFDEFVIDDKRGAA
jgi:hypothetical protein